MFRSIISKKYRVFLILSLSVLWGNLFAPALAVDTKYGATAPAQDTTRSIEQLTQQQRVVLYLQQHQRLPDYYVTKRQARMQGWDTRKGNLCQAMPGHAIGGDRFSNREQQLPGKSERVWREADINYRCGHRGAERVLYSNDGLIYLTHDHYRNFIRVE